MKQADKITLQAFLIALEQLDEPLSEPVQTQLQEIAENIDDNLGELDEIAENNPKLDRIYQEIRIALQNEYTTRNKSSALATDRTRENLVFSQNLSYENQKILNMDGLQLSQMFKDFLITKHIVKIHAQNKPKRKISDFYGIAPNLLGGKDAQEWVNELRQEWQEREDSLRKG